MRRMGSAAGAAGSAAGSAAGVVLAGGRSSRMGTPKAWLEWHGSTFLYRAAAVVGRAVRGPVVVVAAPGQELPPLPPGVVVAEDPVEGRGPLQGLAAGLAAVADRAETAFVCSTDMPLLHPAYVGRVLRELHDTGAEAVWPVAGGFRQPLAAAYRTSLAGRVADLLARGESRLGMLAEHCAVAWPDDARLLADPALAEHDPELVSVLNVNTPEDYAAVRERPAPRVTIERLDESARVTVERLGESARDAGRRWRVVRAATLGAAAAAIGLPPYGPAGVTLNGERIAFDERLPLVAGDAVSFRPPEAAAG